MQEHARLIYLVAVVVQFDTVLWTGSLNDMTDRIVSDDIVTLSVTVVALKQLLTMLSEYRLYF